MMYPVIYKSERFKVPDDYIRYLINYRYYCLCGIRSRNRQSENEIQNRINAILSCPDLFMLTKIALYKSIEWQFEEEWRMICNKKDNQGLWDTDSDCFHKKPKAVYLGRRISEVNEKLMISLAEEKGIPVYKMRLENDNPKYELKFEEVQSFRQKRDE